MACVQWNQLTLNQLTVCLTPAGCVVFQQYIAIKTLANSLSETISDKDLALSHMRHANKIMVRTPPCFLGLQASELALGWPCFC